VTEPVDGGGAQDAVWKRIEPFGDVEVRGHERAFALVALGDDIVEVLVLGTLEGLEAEVVDDQQIDRRQSGKEPVIAVCGPGGMQLGKHPGGGREQDVVAGTDRAVAQGLGNVTLAGAAGTDDDDADLLVHEPAGGQLEDEGAVDRGIKSEVKLLEGLLVAEVGPADGRSEAFLAPAGDLVLDDRGQEVHVGELLLDGLPVTGLDGVQDPGEAKLLEQGDELGHGVHGAHLLNAAAARRHRAGTGPAGCRPWRAAVGPPPPAPDPGPASGSP